MMFLLLINGILYLLIPPLQGLFLVFIIILAVVVLVSFLRLLIEPIINRARQFKLANKVFEKKRAVTKRTVNKRSSSEPIDYNLKEIKKGICRKCGGKLVLRTAKYGKYKGNKFYGCSNFPKCKNIIPTGKKTSSNKNVKKKTVEKSSPVPVCDKCGSKMVLRSAKHGYYKGNEFYGCSNYPECKNIVNISN